MARPLLWIVTVLTLLSACDRNPGRPPAGELKKVNVDVTPWPASASLYIAHDMGYYREEGLDATLQTHTSGHLGLAAVVSGQADFAVSGETPIARAAINGKPFVVVATVCEIDRAILIIGRKDRGVAAPGDLRGKRVGVVPGTTAEFFLDMYLAVSHVDRKGLRVVELAPDKIVDALLKGQVDAVSTWAPQTTILRDKLGANGVALNEPGLYRMTWNVTVAKDLPGRDPELIARFLRAIAKANRFIAEEPAEARVLTAKNTGMEAAALEKEWGDYRPMTVLDQNLILYLEDQTRWMLKKENGANKVPNFLEYVHTEGLKAVSPEAVRIAK
ncbi:MAG: NrtA/SsuA/CpmA family ABC transporter substrate-binding protein [Deltaproteobacteria bacterium]|nr:NrtA/SsuA/CpmA family ABC transporter substrate-binding protein [Deltaproteobacteria bacterium]